MQQQQKSNDLSEAQVGQLYSKAMKLAHAGLNKHSSHLPDSGHVHSLACALIAGRHVLPGAAGSRGPDRAGADADQDSMLEDNYGGGQGGNF
jgi:hypothetical protein